jgi:hypothetical protein
MPEGYRIERGPSGVRFVCADCGNSVAVNQFEKVAGGTSPRTRAAHAMKQHRDQAHKAVDVRSMFERPKVANR